MPSSKKVQALVISRKKSGEADRFVTLFTKEHGFLKAVAKGVRKIPSSRGGHLEPCTYIHAMIQEAKGGLYVGSNETQEYFQELHADADAMSRVRRILHVLSSCFEVDQQVPVLFDAMLAAWRQFPSLPIEKRRLLEASVILQTLSAAGLLFDMRACGVCGKVKPEGDVAVLPYEGAWKCVSCEHGYLAASHTISSREFTVLRYIAHRPQYATHIAITDGEAIPVERAAHALASQAIATDSVVYS